MQRACWEICLVMRKGFDINLSNQIFINPRKERERGAECIHFVTATQGEIFGVYFETSSAMIVVPNSFSQNCSLNLDS
jgi:hypothetical protein